MRAAQRRLCVRQALQGFCCAGCGRTLLLSDRCSELAALLRRQCMYRLAWPTPAEASHPGSIMQMWDCDGKMQLQDKLVRLARARKGPPFERLRRHLARLPDRSFAPAVAAQCLTPWPAPAAAPPPPTAAVPCCASACIRAIGQSGNAGLCHAFKWQACRRRAVLARCCRNHML